MQAVLALEDGRLFWGKAFGAGAMRTDLLERVGEVVFNTSLTGYQEIFTDPSYAGQIVVLTNPHIGNYGTSPSDAESARPYIEGLVVREFSPVSSNWRSTEVADEYLERSGVPVIRRLIRGRWCGICGRMAVCGRDLYCGRGYGCAGGEGARA